MPRVWLPACLSHRQIPSSTPYPNQTAYLSSSTWLCDKQLHFGGTGVFKFLRSISVFSFQFTAYSFGFWASVLLLICAAFQWGMGFCLERHLIGSSLTQLIFISLSPASTCSHTLIVVPIFTGKLIHRLLVQQVLEVSSDWKSNKSESQFTSMEYDFRVTCDSNYYGSGCAKFCRPRDDSFGHSTCSETGEIICLTGWHGDYCNTRKYIKVLTIYSLNYGSGRVWEGK